MRIVAIVALASFVTACSVADVPSGETSEPPITAKAASPSPEGACGTPAKLTAEEVAKLSPCACAKGGKARCIPSDRIPASLASQLEKCDQGACVPETVLTGGAQALRACTAKGKDGRCLSMCVPMVVKYDGLLGRGDGDVCPSDERCVPCENPMDGTRTGICEISENDASTGSCVNAKSPSASAGEVQAPRARQAEGAPPTPRTSSKECCAIGGTTHGRCVVKDDAPADLQGRPSRRECESAEVCVPTDAPTSCAFGGGVCVSQCVDVPVTPAILFDSGECGPARRCLPCVPFGIPAVGMLKCP